MKRQTIQELIILLLLAVLTVGVRLIYTHQTDFDSYWIHGMAESISIFGHAKWVFHPASLFGYYPLSYPSGLMFFLSVISLLTGLSMGATIYITGILSGLIATFLVYHLGKMLGGFPVGIIAALAFSLSPQIIYYSSYIASGRFLLILFYLMFIISLVHICRYIIGKISPTKEPTTGKTFIGHLIMSGFLIIAMMLIHRTFQLTILFIAAAFIAIIYFYILRFMPAIMSSTLMQRFFVKRYKRWKMWPVIDALILVLIIVGLKAIDLIMRNRLMVHTKRAYDMLLPAFSFLASNIWIPISISVVILLVGLAIFWITRRRARGSLSRFYTNRYEYFVDNPHQFFFLLLFIVALALFILQFFGKSFYSPSLEEYETTELFTGTGPLAIFINLIVNYTTAVSIISVFAIIGFIGLIFKKDKSILDVLFIFIAVAFIGILVDKRYVRLFVTPLITIFAGYGLFILYSALYPRMNTYALNACLILIFVLIATGAFIPQLRENITGRPASFIYNEAYWATGQYIRSLDCQCSTITTEELDAGVIIFASSGVPGGSHNIYYYVNKSYITPKPITFAAVKDKLFAGEKVAQLWELSDWIFGGQYYHGRHTRILFDRDYNNREARSIVNDYHVSYYIHDKNLEKTRYLNSIESVSDKVYDNPSAEVYSVTKGRVTP